MEYTEEEVQRVYRKFYPKLLIVLPVEGLVLDFYQRKLLSDTQKTTIDNCSNDRDKIKHFLDNVIYRSIQVGEFTQFSEMLNVMGRSDDVVVNKIANKIKNAFCDPIDHSPASSVGKCCVNRVSISFVTHVQPYFILTICSWQEVVHTVTEIGDVTSHLTDGITWTSLYHPDLSTNCN